MLTHVTPNGIIYEVAIPQEEVERRMAALIRKLYPAYLDLRASTRGAEARAGVVGIAAPLKTEYDREVLSQLPTLAQVTS